MKKVVAVLALVMLSVGYVTAQGTSNTTTTNGSNYNPWANSNWPPVVINWLQNGGPMPQYLVGKVIGAASTWGWQNFGLTPGGMLAKYYAGKLTIVLVSTSPPTELTFLVTYDGSNIIAIMDAF